MAKQLFGTDGIRGRAGEYPLDARTVRSVGLALARRLAAEPGADPAAEVLIGMDTRASGPLLASLLAAGLAEGGLSARFAGVLPTAGVSHLTAEGGFAAGVMISASHNPCEDNGIKVFASTGFKLPDEVESEVEAEILRLRGEGPEPQESPLATDAALEQTYFDHLLSAGAAASRLRRLRLVVDCANGAACRLASRLFAELGMDLEVFADRPNGENINRDCGSLHLEQLQQRVVAAGADLGVAFDGDADRALFVAEDGQAVDGDGVLFVAGRYLKRMGRLPGSRLVTTVMANMGLEKALAAEGVTMARTKVGDKYVLEEMLAGGSSLGGEQSGHVIFKEFANTGDGLLTARMMIEILSAAEQPLSELHSGLKVFPQKLENVRVATKPPIETIPKLAAAIAQSEAELGGNGRVLVRYSGTEPLLRVMVEAERADDVERHVGLIVQAVRAELGG